MGSREIPGQNPRPLKKLPACFLPVHCKCPPRCSRASWTERGRGFPPAGQKTSSAKDRKYLRTRRTPPFVREIQPQKNQPQKKSLWFRNSKRRRSSNRKLHQSAFFWIGHRCTDSAFESRGSGGSADSNQARPFKNKSPFAFLGVRSLKFPAN